MTFSRTTTRIGILGAVAASLILIPSADAQDSDGSFELAQRSNDRIIFGTRPNNQQQASQSLRMSQLEEQLRRLNGQVEELTFQLRQMQDQMRRMQEDNEFRFQELENRRGRRKRSNAAPSATPPRTASQPAVPGSQTLGTITEEQPVGEVSDPIAKAIGQPLDLSTLAGGSNLSAPIPGRPGNSNGAEDIRLPNTSPREEYDRAYGYVLQGNYDLAETGMRNFIDLYPDNQLVPNARFWLGESLYATGRYKEAADTFLKVYTDHPTSSKAPDSLVKLGQSLYGMGERTAACATYSEFLSKHGTAAPVLRRRVAQELRRAQC